MAVPRLRPQDALLEQSGTVLGWLQGLAPEAFERPTVLPGWTVRQLTGHLLLVHTGLAQSLNQPTTGPALQIHEFVKRYRRDVEMITAATLEASAGLTGAEVVAQLESAIDDLAIKLQGGARPSRVITTRRGPTTI
ncbi:MAG: maleylpyruvate isomerase N-terminal domain-containing protein, partial [Propionibacteriaceae bacterium]